MKRLVYLGGLLLTGSILLTGCNNAIPEMDEETQAMVVEYAVGVVQKYDKNHTNKLMEPDELKKAEEKNAAKEASTELSEDTKPKDDVAPSAEDTAPSSNTEIIDQIQEEQDQTAHTLDEFLQMDNVTFSYIGYETTPFYPTDDSEIAFVMNATEGTELLILKFMAQNLTQEEIALDMNSIDALYKISVNQDTSNALFTMLLNDLSKYQGTLAAGESKELVLVREIAKEETGNITSLSIQIKGEDASAVISLEETSVIID